MKNFFKLAGDTADQFFQSLDLFWVSLVLAFFVGAVFIFSLLAKIGEAEEAELAANANFPSADIQTPPSRRANNLNARPPLPGSNRRLG